MICPLQTEIGKYIEVEQIDVRDTFGRQYVIKSRAGSEAGKDVPFGQRWQMYTNAPSGTYKGSDSDGFMFPPSLVRTIEGEPLEEVDILRDEMANMVWGVESKIQDGCGSSIDAGLLASEVGQFIDDANEEAVKKATGTGERKRTAVKRERKVDVTKGRLLNDYRVLLEGLGAQVEPLKTEAEMHFTFEGASYTVKLIKHRPPKA